MDRFGVIHDLIPVIGQHHGYQLFLSFRLPCSLNLETNLKALDLSLDFVDTLLLLPVCAYIIDTVLVLGEELDVTSL